MTDDFMSVAGYGGASSQPPAQQTSVDPDTDAAVRTAYAEAGKDGWAAVANVIRNRATKSGKPYSAVVSDPNAFEGYGNEKYKSLKTGSPQYQAVLQAITPVLQGATSPVGDADAYYSPTGQTAKGRSAPDWSNGKQPVATVGGNVFYNGVYAPGQGSAPAQSDFMQTAGWHGTDPTDLPEAKPSAPAQVTSEPLPAPIARPLKLEDSSLFLGYGGRGQPVFDTLAAGGNTVRFGREANRDLPSTDPNLPPPPKGYYWPEGVEMGADGQPRLDMGPNDPNRVERFDPKLVNDQATAWRLSLTPSGQEAMAQAANAPDANNPGDSGVLAHAANGLMQGWFPVVNGAIGYGQQALINGVNRLTGQPITVTAADAGDAERLGTDMLLREESARHPYTAPIAEVGGSLTSAIPAVEGGVGLLRNVPKVGAFLAGDAGAGTGALNLLTRTASRGVSGALQGAAGGALTTGLTDKNIGENMLTGGLWGGTLGAGGSLAYDTLRGGAGAIKAAAQPFSEQGRNEIVGDTLRKFAAGGPTDPDLTEYVAGSTPTLAQATGNAGLASVERTVRAMNPNPFVEASQRAQQARNDAAGALQGDADSLERLRELRSSAADPIREQAFANAQPVSASPVLKAIDDIVASPSGKRDAVVKALGNIRSKIESDVPGLPGVKTMETDPAQLYGVRQAITDMLSPLAQKDASAPQLASKELMQVKDALDGVIEQGAPGYKKYLKTYADMSRPIDEQQFLQARNLTNANSDVTMAKVKATNDAIRQAQSSPGALRGKSVSDVSQEGLNKLYADFQREASAQPDRAIGPATFQHLANANLMSRLGVPLAIGDAIGTKVALPGAVSGIAGLLARAAYNSRNPLILDQLSSALVNPKVGADLLRAPPPNANKVFGVLPLVDQIPRLAGSGATARNLLMNYRPSGTAEAVP